MTVTEKEFLAVANAAVKLLELGSVETAYCLDDLARKMNRDLTMRGGRGILGASKYEPTKIESPLECAGLRVKKL